MIRVLQVTGTVNRGGAETMIMNIFRNVKNQNLKFDFFTYMSEGTKQDFEQEILDMGGEIIKFGGNKPTVLFILKMIIFLRKNKYDCIHIHTLFNSGIIALVAKISRIPVIIVHSHSTSQIKKENMAMKIYINISRFLINKNSTHYFACSKEAGDYLFGHRNFLKKGIIVKNAVDLSIFNTQLKLPGYFADQFPDNQVLNIGCIGSFYEVKNHMYLIGLANHMIENGFKSFKFHFVGKGHLEKKIKKEIEDQKLDSYFNFLGTRTDINYLMNYFDVLVMPSLFEGIPVTLIESQACGLPALVSTNVSREVDLELGLIHFLDLDNNFKEWFDRLTSSEKLKIKMISNREEQFMKHGYSLEKNVERLEDIYEGRFIK